MFGRAVIAALAAIAFSLSANALASTITISLSGSGANPCPSGYAARGMACPTVAGPEPSCPSGFVGVPSMNIPINTSGGTLNVLAFCVSQYLPGNGPTLGNANTTPQVNISWNTVNAGSCSSVSAGSTMMSESQWMALAHNIMLVGSNWSGGTTGSGSINGGLNNSQCGASGAMSYSACPDSSAPGRLRTLTNGQIVYDIGGNVYQWTYHDLAGGSSGLWGAMPASERMVPYASQTQGMGYYLDVASYPDGWTGWSGYAPLRGGGWGGGAGAGPFLLGNSSPTNANTNIGFRCTK